jgi:tungstate transport system ATP-binding protein
MTIAVELRSATKRFGDVVAVKDASIAIQKGELFGILGPSGAGKSTVLRLVDLLEVPDKGAVSINGEEVRCGSRRADEIRSRIGMILQKPVALNRSVANNIAYSLEIRDWGEEDIQKRVDEELEKYGLKDRRDKNARTLSGGEMQRLSFARSTVFGPEILLLDEFSANLDPKNVALMEDQISRFRKEDASRTVVMVTHNIFQAKRMCDRIALMWDGEIVEVADKKKFFEDPEDPRTAAFVKGEIVY